MIRQKFPGRLPLRPSSWHAVAWGCHRTALQGSETQRLQCSRYGTAWHRHKIQKLVTCILFLPFYLAEQSLSSAGGWGDPGAQGDVDGLPRLQRQVRGQGGVPSAAAAPAAVAASAVVAAGAAEACLRRHAYRCCQLLQCPAITYLFYNFTDTCKSECHDILKQATQCNKCRTCRVGCASLEILALHGNWFEAIGPGGIYSGIFSSTATVQRIRNWQASLLYCA